MTWNTLKQLFSFLEGQGHTVSNVRDRQWTRGVAVGEKQFVKKIKTELGSKAFGRQIRETSGGYELRERMIPYMTDCDSKKVDMGLENTYNWRVFP